MGSKVEEAIRAKGYAEKQFAVKNFEGAKNYALKAQMLCPELEGITQLVATYGVYAAAEAKINGEPDFYSILGMHPSSKISKLKKQYKKLAVLLHPENNRIAGADGAYLLISEAWAIFSDAAKRSAYDQRRKLFAGYGAAAAAGGYGNCSQLSSHGRTDTFWTICTSCHVQYEYLRKYVDKRLSCKNCRGVFIAVETGLTPVNGAFPYSNYSYTADNGHRGHGCGVTYSSSTATGYHAPNWGSSHHTGYRSDCTSNISFQGSSSVKSIGFGDSHSNGLSPTFSFNQANGEPDKTKASGRDHPVKGGDQVGYNGWHRGENGVSKPKRGRPAKIRKVEPGSSYVCHGEISPNIVAEQKLASGSGIPNPVPKLPSSSETLTRRSSTFPVVDGRRLLIDKAKSEINRKLEEMRLASEAAAAAEASKIKKCTGDAEQQLRRNSSMAMTVPDSDFHDFDLDRSEECFKPKQIWALYDEEDGMPRLYCLIRDIISVKPFKIYISYLSSRSDNEFGELVNWLDSGFTKSCGNFRVFHSETVDQVNMFSHLLSREKVGRGGCIRIYPRSGDIWAVYRNWSNEWNRTTPYEVRHQYEMVEVLNDYSEESGVWIAPLVKLDGFKTVYRKNSNNNAIRWIPRREMLRFSHQVPSYLLVAEDVNLPEGCWDLDPAAMPNELFRGESEPQNDPDQMQKTSGTPEELQPTQPMEQSGENCGQSKPCETIAATPIILTEVASKHPGGQSEEKFGQREPVEGIISTPVTASKVATKLNGQETTPVQIPLGEGLAMAKSDFKDFALRDEIVQIFWGREN